MGFDIPVNLVEWPRSGGGLCDGFREFGGMCWIREGEEVRMVKGLDECSESVGEKEELSWGGDERLWR
jgi:hypothetical protein